MSAYGETPPTAWPGPPPLTLALRQTGALLLDALRRLRSARLFWVALGLSALVPAVFALVGINAGGLHLPIYGQLDNPILNTTVISRPAFYKLAFLTLGVNVWLAWAAAILALVSTADLVPSLVGEGSADLYLTRPVGRARLLLTRYVSGLLFAALQALCFALAAMAVLAGRAGVFEPGLLWCVPIVAVFFSYLYAVSALVGLLSGSGVAAILTALLFWMALWAVDTTEGVLLQNRERAAVAAEEAEADVAATRDRLARARASESASPVMVEGYEKSLAVAAEDRDDAAANLASWRRAHRIVMYVKAPLPKTAETIRVLNNRLVAAAELDLLDEQFDATRMQDAERRAQGIDDAGRREAFLDRRRNSLSAEDRVAAINDNRPLWWSIGTSLAFEAAVVGLCCLIFARRDV